MFKNKFKKYRNELAVIALIIIVLISFIIFSLDQNNTKILTGTGKIRCINESLNHWGIELEFSIFNPFRQRKLSIAKIQDNIKEQGENDFINIPQELKKDGLKVKCKYMISDVIGTSEWDVYIKIIDISEIK